MRFASMLAAAVCLPAMSPRSLAQGELYEWSPIQSPRSLAAAGDLNADGLGDWAILEMITTGQPGLLRAFSGANGSELWNVVTVSAPDMGGEVVSLGDADLHGRDDLVVGGLGALRAVSGVDGATLWELSLPGSVRAIARLNDVDVDGVIDLGVGATGDLGSTTGSAYIVSGRTGGVLHIVVAPPGATGAFGVETGSIGDFDGDGVHDFGVGDPATNSGMGEVHVISGRDGSILETFRGPTTSQLGGGGYGLSIVSPGDIDGDSVPELAVSSPWECASGIPGFEGCTNGVVRIISGASAAILLELRSSPYPTGTYPLSYGLDVEVIGDLDADGHSDLLIAAGTDRFGCCIYSAGNVVAVSSVTGEMLLAGKDQSTSLIAVVPDVDGDGLDDYLTAVALYLPKPYAAVALTGRRQPSPGLCYGKQTSEGCWPLLDTQGAPSLTVGPEFKLSASKLPASTLGLIAWSTSGARLPFGGGTLCLGGRVERGAMLQSGGSVGVACSGSIELAYSKSVLASMGAGGTTFHVQGWFRDAGFAPPADIGLTPALTVTIWP